MTGFGNFRRAEMDGVSAAVVGRTLAARMVAKLLADQGATVRRVDVAPPGASAPADGPGTGDGVEVLPWTDADSSPAWEQVLADVDVVVDGTAGGVLASVGIDFDRLRQLRPDIVVCRMPAFPSAPAAPAALDGEGEWAVAAALGLDQMGPRPPFVEPLAISSAYGAVLSALYVSVALLRRDDGAGASDMEVSLFGAGIMALDRQLVSVADPRCADPLGEWRLPIAERYECADGRFIQLQGAVPSVARGVLVACGHPEWADDAVAAITALPGAEEEQRWRDRFASVFRTRPAAEWEKRIAEQGGAAAICRTGEEWVAESHAVEAEIVVPPADRHGRPRIGPAIRVVDAAAFGAPRGTSARPRQPTTIAAGSALALEGVRVVDLSIILAGPTCGRLLAELGAEVLKVDAPDRTRVPYVSPYGWLDVNRSKHSLLLDLKHPDGQEVLWQLIEGADVLVENFRAEKLAALGFTPEAIYGRNPRIVYTSLNAYDFGGSFSPRPGWEQNAQAVSGMQLARSANNRPVRVTVPVNDYGTGLLGTFGTVLGLRAARRTGRGQRVLGSLARTGSFLQVADLSWNDRAAATGRPSHLPGEVAFLQCVDGWVAALRADVSSGPHADRDGIDLGGDWSDQDCSSVIGRLTVAGVAAVEAPSVNEMATLPWVRAAGYVATWKHPVWGDMTNVFAHGTSTSFEQRPGWPSPDPGQDARAVLERAGFAESEIARLLESGVVAAPVPLFGP